MNVKIVEYISDWEYVLERAMSDTHEAGLKAVLTQGLEVLEQLKKDSKKLHGEEIEIQGEVPEQMLCAALSREIAEQTLGAGRMLSQLKEESEERILLQKLVAAGDQMIYGLRKFL